MWKSDTPSPTRSSVAVVRVALVKAKRSTPAGWVEVPMPMNLNSQMSGKRSVMRDAVLKRWSGCQ